jgi:CBS domain-containing protein
MSDVLRCQAADCMTYRPATIRPETTLADVEALFERSDIDAIPVVDENGVLLGIVTRLDLLRGFVLGPTMAAPYETIMRRPVETVMTRRLKTVLPDANLTDVLQLMIDTGHESLPVAIGALLIGMIARRDVTRALRDGRAGPGPRMRAGDEGPSDSRLGRARASLA